MALIFETADAAQDSTTLYQMAAGDQFYGNLRTDAVDWIKVDLVAGQTYNFMAVGLGVLGAGVRDSDIILWAADGTEVARDENGGPGLAASLTFTAVTSGSYFLDVYSYDSGPGARYALSMTNGALPSLGTDMAAAVLYGSDLSWAAAPATAVNVTWAVRASGTTYDGLPLEVLSGVQVAAMTKALAHFAEVANISFTQVAPGGTSNNATILVGGYRSETDGASAYADFPGSTDAAATAGDVWINNTWAPPTMPVGSLDYMIFLHELGHAVGLNHPGDYNGAGFTYADNAQFVQDSHQYTVMSYWSGTETGAGSLAFEPGTLMMFDIHALQLLYGVNKTTRAGNDVYGFNSSLGGAYDFATYATPMICIWDGAGWDTLDLSGYGQAQRIDLNDGMFSDVGGFVGNLSIALNARIESAVGGSGRDTILGNEFNNNLRGGNGGDSLSGGQGDDVLTGGAGWDQLTGGLGSDRFVMRDNFGRDRILGFEVGVDKLVLDHLLWDGVLTATEVVADFGSVIGGSTVLDFGSGGMVTLVNRLVLAELEAAILIL